MNKLIVILLFMFLGLSAFAADTQVKKVESLLITDGGSVFLMNKGCNTYNKIGDVNTDPEVVKSYISVLLAAKSMGLEATTQWADNTYACQSGLGLNSATGKAQRVSL